MFSKKNLLHFFPYIYIFLVIMKKKIKELKISLTLFLEYFLTPKSVQEENIGRSVIEMNR